MFSRGAGRHWDRCSWVSPGVSAQSGPSEAEPRAKQSVTHAFPNRQPILSLVTKQTKEKKKQKTKKPPKHQRVILVPEHSLFLVSTERNFLKTRVPRNNRGEKKKQQRQWYEKVPFHLRLSSFFKKNLYSGNRSATRSLMLCPVNNPHCSKEPPEPGEARAGMSFAQCWAHSNQVSFQEVGKLEPCGQRKYKPQARGS